MKRYCRSWLMGVLVAFCLIGCVTYPARFAFDPEVFQDSSVRIDYRIGSFVYFLQIENRTSSEMTIDSNRASIISSAGQTRSLHLNAEDTHIPPRATLIIRPSQAAAFGTSIDEMFSPSQLSRSDRESFFAERDYLKQFVGTLLRLYLPISIDGKERVYDIPLEIRSVSQAGVPDR